MSIDRETFEQSSEEKLKGLSTTDQVLGFLVANGDRAFKAQEIARQTGLNEGSVSTALSRLKNRDLVEHKATYWAVTADDQRLESHDGYARATALFNEQFGEEDAEVWKEHAPEDPHPSLTDDEE